MDFTNSFSVDAPLDDVWRFMLQADEVAPCVPGARITEIVDARHFKGEVKIKVGPVQVSYRGELEMEPDESLKTITLRAKGTELRGSGGASGLVTTTLSTGADSTHVEIVSHIDVSGRVAQFGRGIMQDVSNRLIREFAACLEQKLEQTQAIDTASASAFESPPGTGHDLKEKPRPPAAVESAPALRPSPVRSGGVSGDAAELRIPSLLLGILRTRTAAALRKLAVWIEQET